jgi:NTE family protein
VLPKKKYKLALALGGGGARGLSHLGFLQGLDRDGLAPDLIIGTSVGSIVGASYALHPDGLELTRRALAYLKGSGFADNPFRKVLFHSVDVEQSYFRSMIQSIKKSYVFSSLIRKPSIFGSERLYDVICDLVPDAEFKDTQIPFAVPAIDIRSGEEVLITEGSLRKALLASCSLPGFFPPVEYGDKLLVDAGVIGPVPVSACRAYNPKVLVAVDISTQLAPLVSIDIGLDAIMRVELIAGRRINEMELRQADLVIRPPVGQKVWADFTDLDLMVESGLAEAKKHSATIRELLFSRKPFRPSRATGAVGG